MVKFTPILLVALLGQLLLCASCQEPVPGCTDPSSPNYDPLANDDDGSCTFSVPDTYTFTRSENNSVSYDLSLSRNLRIARFEQVLLSLTDEGFFYVNPEPIIFNYPDTLELSPLATNHSGASPATIGEYAVSDTLASTLIAFSPLPDLQNLFTDALTYINTQVSAGGRPTPIFYTSPEGVDYARMLPPLLAGAALFRPAVDTYLVAIDTLDNISLSSSSTAAERSWDLAYGAFGLPPEGASWYDGSVDYSDLSNNDTITFEDEYAYYYATLALDRDDAVPAAQFTSQLYQSFREGRAALAFGPERLAEAQVAAMSLRDRWEQLIAASCIHHLNGSMEALSAPALDSLEYRAQWSAAYGFAFSLGLRPDGRLGASGVTSILDLMGEAPSFSQNYTDTLMNIRADLGSTYGFPQEWTEGW